MSSQNQKTPVATKFDYGALNFQQREEVQQATDEIRKRLRRAAQDIWEIGKRLNSIQSQLQRGQFDDWIKTEFDWSRRTAYKFISVYKRFDRQINFDQINIATSALYLLAAESTPEEIRQEFIDKAQRGEKVTHQEVYQVVEESKQKSGLFSQSRQSSLADSAKDNLSSTQVREGKILLSQESDVKEQIISINPQGKVEKPLSVSKTVISHSILDKSVYYLEPGWHQLSNQHHIYYGDTALPDFADSIPYAKLAIAITADDWAHDWLIEKAKTVVVFPESEFETKKLTGLITMFSTLEEILIFPWLPDESMLEIAHQLGRKVYAGDMNYQNCQAAIAKANLALLNSNDNCFILKG